MSTRQLFSSTLLRIGYSVLALAIAQSATGASYMQITSYDFSGKTIPKWRGDTLVSIEDSGTAHFFDSQGREVGVIALTIPGANILRVYDAARHRDGTVALCGYAIDRDGQFEQFIAIAATGAPTKIVRTNPYSPHQIVLAPDGSIWTQGFEVPLKPGSNNSNGGVIRHFDNSGRQLSSFVPQSGIAVEDLLLGISNFTVSGNKVAWYPGRGRSYWEVSFAGVVNKHTAIPACEGTLSSVDSLAVTDDGQAFATRDCLANKRHKHELFLLDRNLDGWKLVQLGSDDTPFLLGGYGNTLVRNGQPGRFEFLNAGELSAH